MAQLHVFYDLQPGENVKLVPPPFIADRLLYYRDIMKDSTNAAGGPDTITFEFDGRKGLDLKWRMATYAGGMGGTVQHALESVAHIQHFDTMISPLLFNQQLPGDWVYRAGASNAQLTEGLSKVFRQRLGMVGSLVQKPIERDVIVASGTFAFAPLPTTTTTTPTTPTVGQSSEPAIRFFRGKRSPGGKNYGVSHGTDGTFLPHIAMLTDVPVVNEAKFPPRAAITWCYEDSVYLRAPGAARDIAAEDEMLANLTRQTGLQFRRERRVVPTWVWETPTTAP
jgi:hypothetical protein